LIFDDAPVALNLSPPEHVSVKLFLLAFQVYSHSRRFAGMSRSSRGLLKQWIRLSTVATTDESLATADGAAAISIGVAGKTTTAPASPVVERCGG
jgi:hypothetical protein